MAAETAAAARTVHTSPRPDKHAGCYWDIELCGWRRHPSPVAAVPQVPTPRRPGS